MIGGVLTVVQRGQAFRAGALLYLDLLNSTSLDSRITFSRTSQATLVDSTGKLTYAPNNILPNSQEFEGAAWTKSATGTASAPTVTANSTVAPDGTTTADTVTLNRGAGNTVSDRSYIWQNLTTLTAGALYIFSFYIKAASSGDIGKQVGYRSVAGGAYQVVTLTNEWQRISVKEAAAATTSAVEFASRGTINADNSVSCFLWGAQLEQVTYQTTPGTYNSTSPKNLLGYTQEFDNAAWTKSNAFVQTNLLTYSEDFTNAAWSKTTAGVAVAPVVTANAAAAPNGTMTADLVVFNLNSGTSTADRSQLIQTATVLNGPTYTSAFYIKAANPADVGKTVRITLSGATGGQNITLTSDYQRVGQSGPSAVTSLSYIIETRGTFNDNQVSVHLWGAQLVQGSTAGDYQRTDAAAAAVQYVAPDGSRTAEKLVESATTGAHYINQNVGMVGTPETFSFYAKAAERGWALAQMGNNGLAYYNLASGTLGTVSSATASITAVGNGWYRCSITATRSSNQNNIIYPATANGTASYTGDGTSGIYVWGSQVSNSASLDPYVYNPVAAPTSAAYYGPRFDYDPVTLANKGLLIEEQRTNLLTYSEQFDNAAWTKSAITVTANNIIAPDGTVTADRITSTGPCLLAQTAAATATSHTFTVFAKQGSAVNEGARFLLRNDTTGNNLVGILMDYSTGLFSYIAGSSGATVTAVGNGWWRITLSATSGITVGNSLLSYVGFTGGGVSGQFMYAWGAQLEAGSFATSYIPTVASQVTRTADVALMQGANFSNWYNQNEGTLFTSASQPTIFASSRTASSVNDSGTNRFNIYRQSAGGINGFMTPGAGVIASNVLATANTPWNAVLAYTTTTGFVSANGSAVATAAHTVPLGVLNNLCIGNVAAAASETFNGHIRRIGYYPTRLANAQLQSLTAQSTIPSLSLDFTTQVFNVG